MHIIDNVIFSFNFIINIFIFFMALMVAYYSYRAHKITKGYDFGYFSLGFLSLSTAFFVNAFSMFVWAMNAAHVSGTLTAHTHFASVLLFRFFTLLGLVLILFATKYMSRGLRGKITIYLFMLIIVLAFSFEFLFYMTSIILLLIIASHYLLKVYRKENNMSLYMFIAMILFLFGITRFFFITPYFCFIQPALFFLSFLIVHLVVIKSYKK